MTSQSTVDKTTIALSIMLNIVVLAALIFLGYLIFIAVDQVDAQESNQIYLPVMYNIETWLYSDPNPFGPMECELADFIGSGRYDKFYDDGYLNSPPCKILVVTSDNKITELSTIGKVSSRFSGVTITLVEYSSVNYFWIVESNLPIKSISIFK